MASRQVDLSDNTSLIVTFSSLIYCYKIMFGYTGAMAPLSTTRGHIYKLYNKRCFATVRSKFFGCQYVDWNNLPESVAFSSLSSFIRAHCQTCCFVKLYQMVLANIISS